MECEQQIIFSVYLDNKDYLFELGEYETVGCLKKKIAKKFGIRKSKLIVTGWRLPPDDDSDILKICADLENINNLRVQERTWENSPERKTTVEEDLELQSCVNFVKEVINNISENVIKFHVDLLANKIAEVCLGPIEKRKVLLLYLHKKDDEFSTIFWRNLKRPEVMNVLNKSFCIIGWDFSDRRYHSALTNALCSNELGHMAPYIERNLGAAVCIITYKIGDREMPNIFSCMGKSTSDADFLNCLEYAAKCQIKGNTIEEEVVTQEKVVINSTVIQQNFANLLGNRDYDSYEYDEHEHLKKSIAYAISGPPTDENGYSKKVNEEVEKLFKKILDKNNEVAEYKDKVEIATIYNCTEPLPEVKKKKLKNFPNDYNPDEDILPFPVFIVRKCHESENPCRIFIDHTGRVYCDWNEYLSENKLPECLMIVPGGGRYEVDKDEKVILQSYFSPACGLGTKILNGLDIASAVGGLTSGGVGVATTILSGSAIAASTPVLAAALPVVGIAALATGMVAGGYSIVRSSMAIHDRVKREEPMGFFESSEARGAYLNIVAGGLGFVGAGTNVIFSQLVSQGVQIGTGAKVAVNAINVINLGAGGVSMANSIGDVIYQYVEHDEAPSALTILQLSSNILFFGHAVFNFKTASTIIDETQARILKDYNDSLRSNRHRKTFNKILKSTINQNEGNAVKGKAEVISALKNIQNKDETFAALTRNLSKLKKEGIKVFFENGEVQFNGISIDMTEFSGVPGSKVKAFLTNLPMKSDVTPTEVKSMQNLFSNTGIKVPNVLEMAVLAARFLSGYDTDIKEKIITALASLLNAIAGPVLRELGEILPTNRVYVEVFNTVLEFFSRAANEMEDQYQRWTSTKSEKDYNPLFDYVDVEATKRIVEFMKKAVVVCFEMKYMKKTACKRLVTFFYEWFVSKYSEYQEEQERKRKRITHSAGERYKATKVSCKVCGGYYFQSNY